MLFFNSVFSLISAIILELHVYAYSGKLPDEARGFVELPPQPGKTTIDLMWLFQFLRISLISAFCIIQSYESFCASKKSHLFQPKKRKNLTRRLFENRRPGGACRIFPDHPDVWQKIVKKRKSNLYPTEKCQVPRENTSQKCP